MVEGYLLTRYPRSDDPSSGPASYWPEDAFEIIKVFCVLTLVAFVIAFVARRSHIGKKDR